MGNINSICYNTINNFVKVINSYKKYKLEDVTDKNDNEYVIVIKPIQYS